MSEVPPDPAGQLKQLMDNPYIQYVIREEVKKHTAAYWKSRWGALTGVVGAVTFALGLLGYQFVDLLNVRQEIAMFRSEANGLVADVRKTLGQVSGEAEKFRKAMDDTREGLTDVRRDQAEVRKASADILQVAKSQGAELLAIADKAAAGTQSVGNQFLELAKSSSSAAQQSVQNVVSLQGTLQKQVEDAQAATNRATSAMETVARLEAQTATFKEAVERLNDVSKTWVSESVTVLSRDKDQGGVLSRPTVNLSYPGESPEAIWKFAFEMESPGSSVNLRVTVTSPTGTSEQWCKQSPRSSAVHGKTYRLGSSKFFMRTDFVYQSLLSDDYLMLRVLAIPPLGNRATDLDECSRTWPK